MPQSTRRKLLGTILILVGLLLLLGIGGAFAWQQWQGAMLRQQLQAKVVQAAPAAVSPAAPEQPGSGAPAAAMAAPTSIPDLAPAATAVPAPSESPSASLAAQATEAPSPTAVAALAPTKPVRLAIPDLKIDVLVSDMGWKLINGSNGPQSEWVIPENAAGRAINSALLGEQGNLVISGHNNIAGRVLMPVSQAWPSTEVERIDAYTEKSKILDGRKIVLEGEDGRKFAYLVTAFYRVKDSGVPLEQRVRNGKFMDPTTSARLTLTTCWPPWSNTHRLIVIAQPAS